MLWKIIKNNYGMLEENMFLYIIHPHHMHVPDIKHCDVLLQSNIYDINYRTFFAIIKKESFATSQTSRSSVPSLIRCNGK